MERERVRAIIIQRKKVLLVTSEGAAKFWTPGGHQEGDETYRETMERELMEELNLRLVAMEPITSLDSGKGKGRSFYYLCEVRGEPRPSSEISEFRWVTFREFEESHAASNERLLKVLRMLHAKRLL